MKNDWLHRILDGEGIDAGETRLSEEESRRLASYRNMLSLLENSAPQAPPDLTARVMNALPKAPKHRTLHAISRLFPTKERRLALASGAALAVALVVAGLTLNRPAALPETWKIEFTLHAPEAQRVELLGSFNGWKPGTLLLDGPDGSGHWAVSLELPEGRYEYIFLVDGKKWVTDPAAGIQRPDGFGRRNAVLEL